MSKAGNIFAIVLSVLFFSPWAAAQSTGARQEALNRELSARVAGDAVQRAASEKDAIGVHQEMMKEYERRLFPVHDCVADLSCAQLQKMTIREESDGLYLDLEIHAQARASLTLPSLGGAQWARPEGEAKFVRSGNSIGLLAEKGVSKISLGVLPIGSEIVFGFAQGTSAPKVVGRKLSSWTLDIPEKGRASSLKLVKIKTGQEEKASKAISAEAKFEAPIFVDMRRVLTFNANGVSEQITLTRLTPSDKPAAIVIELGEGEKILNEGVASEDGKTAKVTFAAGQKTVDLSARWDGVSSLNLTASKSGEKRETWVVQPWRRAPLKIEGLLPVAVEENATNLLFLPKPGEKVFLVPQEITPAKGAQVAVDELSIIDSLGGDRIERNVLFKARSPVGSPLEMSISEDWTLLSSLRNKQPSSPSRRDGKYVFDLSPGSNSLELNFKRDGGGKWWVESPKFELASPAANLKWSLAIPNDRWVLFTWGPLLGPAVLIWGVIIGLGILSWVLAKKMKASFAPSFWGWLGLLVPLSATSVWSSLVLMAFLFALSAKEQAHESEPNKYWNWRQFSLFGLAGASALILLSGVYGGLLGMPDMMVSGNGSSAQQLIWYEDKASKVEGAYGGFEAGAILAPIWVWRVIMLAWALWIAGAVMKATPKIWQVLCFGGLWRKKPKKSNPDEETAIEGEGAAEAKADGRQSTDESAPADEKK